MWKIYNSHCHEVWNTAFVFLKKLSPAWLWRTPWLQQSLQLHLCFYKINMIFTLRLLAAINFWFTNPLTQFFQMLACLGIFDRCENLKFNYWFRTGVQNSNLITGPKIFWHIQGPKLICFDTFKGCFCQRNKQNKYNIGFWGPI